MKNMLALVGPCHRPLLPVSAGTLGWYHVAVSPTTDGHQKVEFDVNTSKLKDDVSSGYEKSKEFIDTFRKDKPAGTATAPAEDSKDFVGPPKPTNLTPAPGNNTGTTGTPGPTPFK